MVTSSRQAVIANIIQQRKPFKSEIERIQAALDRRASALKTLEQLQARITSGNKSPLLDEVKAFDFATIRGKVEQMKQDLEKAKTRFSRDTLNIGVIGRARQGKSRLLQSLSDLNTTIIPTGSTEHCTGTRSLICHDPNQTPHGEITFYSEQEFLTDVIGPYYKELALGTPPLSLSEFAGRSLPPLPSNSPNKGYVVPAEQYRHLQNYKDYLNDYRPLINAPTRSIPIQDVRAFVAQDTPDGKGKYYNFMAVKEARIICEFRHPDVGQIALVDMPGLGDTGVGAEERLVRALGEHIDAVLFVLMPSPVAGILADVDFDLYDLAHRSLEGLPVERWSFMVLNHTEPPAAGNNHNSGPVFGDNFANCQHIRDKIQSGSIGFNDRRIKVVNTLIANCSRLDEAKDEILEKVLQYLAGEMNNLDREYLSSWGNRLASLQTEITTELEKAQRALSAAISRHGDVRIFQDLFNILWRELTTGLIDLIDEVQRFNANRNTTMFADYFKRSLDKCRQDTELPNREDFKGVRNEEGAYVIAYSKFLDRMRTNLTHHFIDIDDNLSAKMDEVKRQVVDALLDRGRLRNMAQNVPEEDFLEWMALHPSLSQRLQSAFKALNAYELSFRGFFQYRIRSTLKELTPDLATKRPTALTMDGATPLQKIDGTIALLKEVHKDAVNELEQVLERFALEPSKAALAIVEEFVDQVLRAKEAENDWRVFYQTEKENVWVAEFASIVKLEQIQKDWQTQVRHAQSINASDSLQFFNTTSRRSTGSLR